MKYLSIIVLTLCLFSANLMANMFERISIKSANETDKHLGISQFKLLAFVDNTNADNNVPPISYVKNDNWIYSGTLVQNKILVAIGVFGWGVGLLMEAKDRVTPFTNVAGVCFLATSLLFVFYY